MEINEEFWWESLDEYIISEINEFESSLDEYYGHLQILFIDEPLITKYGGHDDQLSRSIEAIEKFRIKALEGILENSNLSKYNRGRAVEMIIKKLNIYYNGLVKRKKHVDAKKVTEKIKFWNKNLFEY